MAVRSHFGTLVATTQQQVTLDQDYDYVEVVNISGTAAIVFTVDGLTITSATQDNVELVPGIAGARVRVPAPGQTSLVNLFSTGTPTYYVVGRPILS